jgi:NAD(P)-dependent dehydrogenase (short-subunit alcohol dehydrogenase family)
VAPESGDRTFSEESAAGPPREFGRGFESQPQASAGAPGTAGTESIPSEDPRLTAAAAPTEAAAIHASAEATAGTSEVNTVEVESRPMDDEQWRREHRIRRRRKGMRAARTALLSIAGLAAVATLIGTRKRRQMYRFRGRTAVITGGSRGLGLVLARHLAAEGANIALLARHPNELDEAADDLRQSGAEVLVLPCDVRHRSEVNRAVARTAEHFGRIDVLINNAGIIQVGPLEHMRVDDFEEAMAVHMWGPLYTTMAVLPYMRRDGGGRIVNISSIGGKVAVPHMAPYCASKFALVGLSDALRSELHHENILVTTVCPGLMRTGSPPNAFFKGAHEEEYAWFTVGDSLPLLSIDADRAAQRILEACRRGQARATIGATAKAAVVLSELFPGLTARLTELADRFMPEAEPGHSPRTNTGWESDSEQTPVGLTRLTDEAAIRNLQTTARH